MASNFTPSLIAKLPPGQYPDAVVPGLNLYVGDRGKTWKLRIRNPDGSARKITMGRFPQLSILDARIQAGEAKAQAEAGEIVAPAVFEAPLLLGDLIDRYEAYRIGRGTRIKSLSLQLTVIRAKLGAHLGRPAKDFTKADLRALRDHVAKRNGGVMSNRFLQYLNVAMQWAASEDLIETNFVRDLNVVGAETKRDRVLSKAEIVAVWQATASGESYDRLVRFLLLTGCRKEEAATLRFGDFLDGVWYQRENKTSAPVQHRLSAAAMAIVGAGEASALVFPGRLKNVPLTAGTKPKARLDRLSGVTDWVQHDLRRTMATHMQDLEVMPHVIELCLNHKLKGVAGVYQRSQLLDLKLDAWERWAAFILRSLPLTLTVSH
jgi:integrase